MRWIVLPLSLGPAIMSVVYCVFTIWAKMMSMEQNVTWLAVALLIVSAVLALIGGLVAFNRHRAGGGVLLLAAALCFFSSREANARIFSGFYLAAGLLSFTVRRPSKYRDYAEDEEYDEEDEEDELPTEEEILVGRAGRSGGDFRGISYGKRRERHAAQKNSGEEARTEEETLSRLNESVRARTSRVCLTCGASVGADHKFCFTCGAPLMSVNAPIKPAAPDAAFDDPSPEEKAPRAENWRQASLEFKGFQAVYPTDAPKPEEDDTSWNEEEDEEEPGEEPSLSRRVFVQPQKEETPAFKRPLMISPDSSYQEFSAYTRRRKRKRQAWPRRISSLLILLLAMGGAVWFLLGSRRIPPDPVKRDEPAGQSGPIDPGDSIGPNDDGGAPSPDEGIAVPVRQPNEPPPLLAASPTRGVVTGTNVNLRPDHSTTGSVIAKLGADARAEILEQWEGTVGALSGPWFRIRTGDNKEGWIYGQYFQPLDGRGATLTSGYTASQLKTFGTTKTELTRELGQPTRQTATTLTWKGLTANARGEGEITRLQITSAEHVLLNGTAVGITEEQLYKNVGYPSEYKSGQLRYIESGSQGMAVRMQNGKVQSIIVGNI